MVYYYSSDLFKFFLAIFYFFKKTLFCFYTWDQTSQSDDSHIQLHQNSSDENCENNNNTHLQKDDINTIIASSSWNKKAIISLHIGLIVLTKNCYLHDL